MATRREREQRQAQREGYSSVYQMRKAKETERAERRGFTNVYEMRRVAKDNRITGALRDFPVSYENFLGDRPDTKSEREMFERAFGPGKGTTNRIRIRAEYIDSDRSSEWDWRAWRNEYNSR